MSDDFMTVDDFISCLYAYEGNEVCSAEIPDGKTPEEAWASSQHADWMLRYANHVGVDRFAVVRAMVALARAVLPVWEAQYPTDRRPGVCLDVVEVVLRGKGSPDLGSLAEAASNVAAVAAHKALNVDAGAFYAAFTAGFVAIGAEYLTASPSTFSRVVIAFATLAAPSVLASVPKKPLPPAALSVAEKLRDSTSVVREVIPWPVVAEALKARGVTL